MSVDLEKPMGEPAQLERGLGLLEATSLNMTFMVGIGPFVVIPFVIQAMHGPLRPSRVGPRALLATLMVHLAELAQLCLLE